MKKDELVEEVKILYKSSEFSEFAQWAEETFLVMIPYLPVEKLKELKKELNRIKGYHSE